MAIICSAHTCGVPKSRAFCTLVLLFVMHEDATSKSRSLWSSYECYKHSQEVYATCGEDYDITVITVFARSDTAATINFTARFCAANN